MTAKLENLQPTSKAAKFRLLLPLIEKKIAEGVKATAIVEALKADGLDLTLATFRLYLNNHRKKKPGAAAVASNPLQPAKVLPLKIESQKDAIPKKEITLPDMTPEEMEYYEEMGKNGIID